MMTVIDWLATQEWSTGNVGMYGTSYSGFNSIQLAMERPPALKAIIPIYATDDRYADDVHYMGGAVKQLDQVDYPTYMVALNALPPVPGVYGEGWREEWERRVRGHRAVGAHVARASAVRRLLAVRLAAPGLRPHPGGHHDHRRVGRRLPEQLAADVRATAVPDAAGDRPVGARVDRHVAARTEHRPGAGDDPVVGPVAEGRGQRHRPRAADRAVRAAVHATRCDAPDDGGRVAVRADVAGRTTPSDTAGARRRRDTDAPTDGDDDVLEVRGDVGWTAWISCAASLPWGQPDDQRPDEAFSLTYTWPELEQDLEILGHARLTVSLTSSAPIAYLSAKLCDVFPDGASSLVTPEHPQPGAPRLPRGAVAAGARSSVRDHDRPRGRVVDVRGGPSHPPGPGRHGLAERLVRRPSPSRSRSIAPPRR